jgi:hypothetical protein
MASVLSFFAPLPTVPINATEIISASRVQKLGMWVDNDNRIHRWCTTEISLLEAAHANRGLKKSCGKDVAMDFKSSLMDGSGPDEGCATSRYDIVNERNSKIR